MAATRNVVLRQHNQSTLALAVEPSMIRACIIEAVGSEQRLAAWITVQRDLDAALTGQIETACKRMGQRLGRELWDEARHRPLFAPPHATHLPYVGSVTAAVNPRPRLRVWLAGLSAQVSLAAAKQAILATPSQIVGETILNATLAESRLTADWARVRPDVLVVVGGHDDEAPGAQKAMLALCKILGQALASLSADAVPMVLYAGNRWAADPAAALLGQAHGQNRIEIVDNVKPEANSIYLTGLAQAIQNTYWRRSRQVLGIAAIEKWVTDPARLTALDWSFAQLVRVWMDYHGLAELYAINQTAQWHQHVWVRSSQDVVRTTYTEPDGKDAWPDGWPTPQLLCGAVPATGLPPTLRWWDRGGMAPVISTLGQISPAAMLQVLQRDLFGRDHAF